MRVVEQDEAERLKATGVWFDCPAKARRYKLKVEDDIKRESKGASKPPKTKSKGK